MSWGDNQYDDFDYSPTGAIQGHDYVDSDYQVALYGLLVMSVQIILRIMETILRGVKRLVTMEESILSVGARINTAVVLTER